MQMELADLKSKYIELYKGNIERPGADKLLEWLEKSDFFTAPASTRHHLARPGGLVEHSIGVYNRLVDLCAFESSRNPEFVAPTAETIAIVSLLHDLCKVNVYKPGTRNVKDENGKWQQVPTFNFEETLPYGHGEKSVYIISGFMRLSREEAMAIRWHMGGWSEASSGDIGIAFNMYPLALLTHIADMESTYLDEERE